MMHTTRFGIPADESLRTWQVTGPAESLYTELGERRARVAALITLGLPGACYLYQFEELGLPEVCELPWDVLDDPVARRSEGTQRARRLPGSDSVDRRRRVVRLRRAGVDAAA